jgi:GNAT superfamily N-acetyltransferase
MSHIAIVRIRDLSPDRFAELLAESEQAGFRFVRRLVEEWQSGSNRFARPGEALFAAVSDGRVVGICGLNVDPYASCPSVGRVRRLYVLSAFRRQGVGRRLVQEVIAACSGCFRSLRLRTETAEASRLYSALGFQECVSVPDCTHVMELGTA